MADHRFTHRGNGFRHRGRQERGVDVDLVVVGVEGLGDQVGIEVLVAGFAVGGVESDTERGQPVLALLGQQRHHDRRVDATGEQARRPGRRRPSVVSRRCAARPSRRPASRRSTRTLWPDRGRTPVSSRRCRCANRRAGSPAPSPAAACARRGRSCAAPAPPSGRSCSGAAPGDRVRCRRRPRLSSARTVEANRSRPGAAAR